MASRSERWHLETQARTRRSPRSGEGSAGPGRARLCARTPPVALIDRAGSGEADGSTAGPSGRLPPAVSSASGTAPRSATFPPGAPTATARSIAGASEAGGSLSGCRRATRVSGAVSINGSASGPGWTGTWAMTAPSLALPSSGGADQGSPSPGFRSPASQGCTGMSEAGASGLGGGGTAALSLHLADVSLRTRTGSSSSGRSRPTPSAITPGGAPPASSS